MNEPGEDEVREQFQQLRVADRGGLPDFRTSWDLAEARTRTARRATRSPSLWIAAAAVVLVTAGIALSRSADRSADSMSITDWTSPTAGLLRTAGHELLAPSSIFSSTLDGAVRAPVPRKGE